MYRGVGEELTAVGERIRVVLTDFSGALRWKCMAQKKQKSQKTLAHPVTLGELGRFTDEVILPGVGRIVDEKLSPLREDVAGLRQEMKHGFSEMRKGFVDVHHSIRALAGETAELKVRGEDQKHEERIRRLEEKVGIRPKA